MGWKLFGLVSPRRDFKLKTTLHGWTEGLVVNGWQLVNCFFIKGDKFHDKKYFINKVNFPYFNIYFFKNRIWFMATCPPVLIYFKNKISD